MKECIEVYPITGTWTEGDTVTDVQLTHCRDGQWFGRNLDGDEVGPIPLAQFELLDSFEEYLCDVAEATTFEGQQKEFETKEEALGRYFGIKGAAKKFADEMFCDFPAMEVT